jgi:hypothetical protein
MLAFRSEAHLKEWLERGNPNGERMTLEQQWELAQRWFAGRHLPSWEPRTKEQAEAVSASVGLTTDFWSLTATD